MTRHHSQRVNNRGTQYNLTSGAKQRLEDDADILFASLSANNQPESIEEKNTDDDSFGLAEVVMAFGVFALAGLLNMQL